MDREAGARAAVLRFVSARFADVRPAGGRFAVGRFAAMRGVDLLALVRRLVRFAGDRFDMIDVGFEGGDERIV
jgi:hypothetical protein